VLLYVLPTVGRASEVLAVRMIAVVTAAIVPIVFLNVLFICLLFRSLCLTGAIEILFNEFYIFKMK